MRAGDVAALGVRLYQYSIGLVVPPACRFHPTCSAYAIEALKIDQPTKVIVQRGDETKTLEITPKSRE